MKKYKLSCFNCGSQFKSKEEVFRDQNNYPICEDCLCEWLADNFWEEYDDAEYTIRELKTKFNRSFRKWEKWFYNNHVVCDEKHDYYANFYVHKDEITVIDGKNYCSICIDNMEDKKRELA